MGSIEQPLCADNTGNLIDVLATSSAPLRKQAAFVL
tara:strand:- start:797 stop:904 length:108 start_codon:yes stop_codon:yes gene_type:complete